MTDENDDDGEERSDGSDRLLWDHFSESAVQNCLERLKQNADMKSIPVHSLMNGRGAVNIWPLVDEQIRRDPCLGTIAIVASMLPFRWQAALVDKAAKPSLTRFMRSSAATGV